MGKQEKIEHSSEEACRKTSIWKSKKETEDNFKMGVMVIEREVGTRITLTQNRIQLRGLIFSVWVLPA
jgi:hypothetical protein